MGWRWHQLDPMQIICTSLQTDDHASTSPLSFLHSVCPSGRPANSVRALKATQVVLDKRPLNGCLSVLYSFVSVVGWLCTGEQWLDARKFSSTSMHVLRPMAISIDLFQCMIASSDLPKYEPSTHEYLLCYVTECCTRICITLVAYGCHSFLTEYNF